MALGAGRHDQLVPLLLMKTYFQLITVNEEYQGQAGLLPGSIKWNINH